MSRICRRVRHGIRHRHTGRFPEHVEFDGEDVLKPVVQGQAGRTIK